MHLRAFFIALAAALPAALPASAQPAHDTFKHIVIVVQEGRTPDNLFGSNPKFEPGVEIASTGVTSKGTRIPLTAVPLAGCYSMADTHASFEAALTAGFDTEPLDPPKDCSTPADPAFAYVDNSSGAVQPYFDIAKQFGFANQMFQTNQGPSFPAHQFLFSGTSAPKPTSPLFAAEDMTRAGNAGCIAPRGQRVALIDSNGSETSYRPALPCFNREALSTVLEAATPKVSWRYYAAGAGAISTAPNAISSICQAGQTATTAGQCTGADWTANVVPDNPAQVLTDIAACDLPAVSWVMPSASASDAAGVNSGLGPQWVASIVNAVGTQTCASGEDYWKDTAIIITWAGWGGWFDHIEPFRNNVGVPSHGALRWGAGYTYGFRVPLLFVSAYTPAGTVNSRIFDYGSILLFVEQNFHLGFIGPLRGRYGAYDDYYADWAPFGLLKDFVKPIAPKTFVPISTSVSAADFIKASGFINASGR